MKRLGPTILLTLLSVAYGSGCNRVSKKVESLTPRQAGDFLSRLDRSTIHQHCGELKSASKPSLTLLEYPFGYFIFEREGTALMEATIQIPGGSQIIWTNAQRDSTDEREDVRKDHRLSVGAASMQAMLDGITVYDFEDKQALKIVQNTPCLAGLVPRD